MGQGCSLIAAAICARLLMRGCGAPALHLLGACRRRRHREAAADAICHGIDQPPRGTPSSLHLRPMPMHGRGDGGCARAGGNLVSIPTYNCGGAHAHGLRQYVRPTSAAVLPAMASAAA